MNYLVVYEFKGVFHNTHIETNKELCSPGDVKSLVRQIKTELCPSMDFGAEPVLINLIRLGEEDGTAGD